MNLERDKLAKEIFANALEKADAAARAAYLTEACGNEAELRREVESLLQAHGQAHGFLGGEACDPPEGEPGEGPGSVTGRYKLLQLIGEGGFGRVYMAEQLEPVRRKVALKIIKLGMDTREVIARFEAERQALALMDHPNIAQMHDGGATPTGRPYFVMELVKGIPITDYCDRENLSTEKRLRLFMEVCHAVQHAHQKGVIHRDLKPTNILVTVIDGRPVPKVIDFGIAKAIGHKLTQKTLFTRFEQMIGTPAYLSPEQAALSGVDVDTRSDIYSLGVMLYELLTGVTPFDQETLRKAGLDEIRRMIREVEPPKPSTRLRGLGEKLTEVAQRRQTEPSVLPKLVRGDLDWIVMKALEKDRQRRYETANGLAQDLERHLKHEPVQASPPSRVYRARKFVRRHRVGVSMAGAVTVALVLGLTASVVGFRQARRERERARGEAAIAAAVNEFLQQDLLAQADPENEPDRDLKLRTVLDRAAQKIEGRFTNQPLVEATVRLTLASAFYGLGDYAAAQAHTQRAVDLRTKVLGPEHRETLEAREALGWTYNELGRNEEAEHLWQGLWQVNQRVLGEDHTNTLSAFHGLGSAFLNQERYAKAEEVYAGLLDSCRRLLGSEHHLTLSSMNSLGLVYLTSDQPDKAVEIMLQVLEADRKRLGVQHPSVLVSMHNLAACYDRLGRLADAINLAEQVVAIRQQVLGANHPTTLISKRRLIEYYGQGCRWQPCAALCKEILGSTNTDSRANALWWSHAPTCSFKGAVASLLAGDNASYRYFAAGLFDQFRTTTNGDNARMLMEIAFLIPADAPDWASYLRLADLVRTNANPAQALNNKLAIGMLEFRRSRWEEAFQWLETARRSGWSPIDSQAGYFTAMTEHERGHPVAARAALEEANRRFAPSYQSGSFGVSTWHEYGRAAITRAEAERMILGQTSFQLLTPETLESVREAWAPVRQRLLEARRFAAQGNWSKARDAYLQAMAEPVFDWETAEVTESWLLSLKVGTVFLRAQDWTNRRQLCERLAARLETVSDPRWARLYASICLIATNDLPPELVRKAIGWARQGPAGLGRHNFFPFLLEGDRLGDLAVTAGMAAYRAGDYEQALTVLASEQNPKEVGKAGTALAFRSMSLCRLGRQTEAREVLQQAESLLAKPLENLTGDRWHRLAVAQVALEEARQLCGDANAPRAQSANPPR